jgi:hypothetical protein
MSSDTEAGPQRESLLPEGLDREKVGSTFIWKPSFLYKELGSEGKRKGELVMLSGDRNRDPRGNEAERN